MNTLILIGLGLVPLGTYAYIDPNAGGRWFQMLMPLFGALVTAWILMRNWMKGWRGKTAAEKGIKKSQSS